MASFFFNSIYMFKDSFKFIFVAGCAIIFYGCPPLHYRIFVRNTTLDTAKLTLLCKGDCKPLNKNITVRGTINVVAINNKTLPLLNEKIAIAGDSAKGILSITPHSTLYLTDLINSYSFFADKSLVVSTPATLDTMLLNYPFTGLKNVKRKRDNGYNFFYRTVIYFDIRK